ncbi:MAG: N-acetylneuraminic acid synthase [Verrucomicrobia bacterium]|nr:N-acetylneuraminic acid synthase [Verrucomicrobiota bacterium]
MNRDVFENLFVLEMTNNHQGNLDRGLQIIKEHSRIVRCNNIRAAIKLQFRDVHNFIHQDFRERLEIRYINRLQSSRLSKEEYAILIKAITKSGCIPMATPFDESSVDWCVEFDLPIIKIASADSNDWMLLEKIAATKKPCIISFGGTPLKDMDDVVLFFENRNIPLAINHCVAAYPHEDSEAELGQIDFLKNRYPGHTIGYSSHEYKDWHTSIAIAYAKGARTFERHIDINSDGFNVASYSSLPDQIDTWFRAFHKTVEFCGTSSSARKVPLEKETNYLDSYIRGVYAKRDLKAGDLLTEEDIYMAIPLQKGQISCRELMLGKYGHRITKECIKDQMISIDHIDLPHITGSHFREVIYSRGL